MTDDLPRQATRTERELPICLQLLPRRQNRKLAAASRVCARDSGASAVISVV